MIRKRFRTKYSSKVKTSFLRSKTHSATFELEKTAQSQYQPIFSPTTEFDAAKMTKQSIGSAFSKTSDSFAAMKKWGFPPNCFHLPTTVASFFGESLHWFTFRH